VHIHRVLFRIYRALFGNIGLFEDVYSDGRPEVCVCAYTKRSCSDIQGSFADT